MQQPDLFHADPRPDLLPDGEPRVVFRADPAQVRAKLHVILGTMRDAHAMPWDARERRYHQTVFPQMSRWLPDDEAAQLRFEFEAEMERLLAA